MLPDPSSPSKCPQPPQLYFDPSGLRRRVFEPVPVKILFNINIMYGTTKDINILWGEDNSQTICMKSINTRLADIVKALHFIDKNIQN